MQRDGVRGSDPDAQAVRPPHVFGHRPAGRRGVRAQKAFQTVSRSRNPDGDPPNSDVCCGPHLLHTFTGECWGRKGTFTNAPDILRAFCAPKCVGFGARTPTIQIHRDMIAEKCVGGAIIIEWRIFLIHKWVRSHDHCYTKRLRHGACALRAARWLSQCVRELLVLY